jgi:hypothetical protein
MAFFLVHLSDWKPFDQEKVERILSSASRATRRLPGNAIHLVTYELPYDGDVSDVSLQADRTSIKIDGSGSASLKAALLLQKHYGDTIWLLDEAYTFDFPLIGLESEAELLRKIRELGA